MLSVNTKTINYTKFPDGDYAMPILDINELFMNKSHMLEGELPYTNDILDRIKYSKHKRESVKIFDR